MPWAAPHQLDGGAPGIKNLLSLVSTKIPQARAIEAVTIDLQTSDNFFWGSRLKGDSILLYRFYIVGSKKNLSKPAPLMLCGRELPYVKQADHLGNMLTEQGDMEQDAVIKRAKFIQSPVEIRETFKFAAREEIIRCLKVYSNSFFGSSFS